MNIDVTKIQQGLPGISPIAAQQLYETFEVCMHKSQHPEIVALTMDGIYKENITLQWQDGYNEQKSRTYTDSQYTTEHGAVCLSVMLTTHLTPYTIIERSRKGTGVDYWLGEKDSFLFQRKARLEVSGIQKGNESTVQKRFQAKIRQTNRSDQSQLPAYISIIEFSTPYALIALK